MFYIGVVDWDRPRWCETTKYATVSLPLEIAKEMDVLISGLGYWPSRSAFVREACLEKIRVERKRMKNHRATASDSNTSREIPAGGLTRG